MFKIGQLLLQSANFFLFLHENRFASISIGYILTFLSSKWECVFERARNT